MRKAVFYILLIIVIVSCGSDTISKKAPKVDHIEIEDINIVRFDKLIQSLDTTDIIASYEALVKEHPYITNLYFNELLNFKSEAKDSFHYFIKEFVVAEPIVSLQESVDKVFPNLRSVEKDLNKAQRYLKYNFPDYRMPNFYSYITEFGYQTILFSDGERGENTDGIGIGLDMYLGSDFDYKQVDPRNPIFSDYITANYSEEYIVRNAMEIISSDLMGEPRGKRMLDQMLHNGKRLYIMENLMPWVSDSIIMEYTSDNMEWVVDNELQIWDYFLENNLVYETNHLKVNKYINPSPNSPGMPAEAPGKTATFIGWQIVRSYMNRNPNASLADLIALTESQKLLELSRYKPKRR